MTVLNIYKFICIETKSHISHIYRQCMVSICDKISFITDILYISIIAQIQLHLRTVVIDKTSLNDYLTLCICKFSKMKLKFFHFIPDNICLDSVNLVFN